ncbi:putative F-box domain-containing protein [Rosa chinensis]|uniref:Putative F-box domain-containing protein n=1 Tax=Rosa chinensis TaxID=74649 RepID=A0A2P6RCM1_ROSCH|nr:putative F-box domain-containing protein [Rosa chinensis]
MSSRRRPMDDHNRWSKHLPDILIEMIVKRLTLVDSIRFAAVCPSWRSVSSQWSQRVTRLPWLLDSTEILDSETVNYRLYSPSEDRVYDLKFPRENNKLDASHSYGIRCLGSIDGWLIMSEWTLNNISYDEKSINYFLNPMTGDRIKLPQQTEFIPETSAASSDPRRSDCIVAIGEGSNLVFCRPCSHELCPWEGHQDCDVQYVKFHEDGKLYIIGLGDTCCILVVLVLVLDPLNQCQGKGKCEKIIAYREKTISAPGDPYNETVRSWSPSFTWSSKGEFLLVWSIFRDGFPFQVFRIDDKSGYNPIWVNLGTNDIAEDEVVFLSALHSTLMSKSKSFMTTIDEAFLGLHCGKFFTYLPDRSSTCDLKILDWVWFTPNITK